jgi:phage shock protein C
VSNENGPVSTKPDGGDSTGWVVLGVALVVVGAVLGAQQLGIVPWRIATTWEYMVKARGGLGIVLVGILLIVWSQSGHRFTAPAHGTKLYRSRGDKWLAGVLGGLADYFSIDVTLLRLMFIALVVLFDVGALVVVYIVMAIVVPVEPEIVPVVPAAPAPSSVPVPPSPPVPVEPAPPVDAGPPSTDPPAGVTQP